MSVVTNKGRIIAALREGGRSLGQIARDLGVTKNSVVGHARRLRQAGEVIVTSPQPQSLRDVPRVVRAAPALKIVRVPAAPALRTPPGGGGRDAAR